MIDWQPIQFVHCLSPSYSLNGWMLKCCVQHVLSFNQLVNGLRLVSSTNRNSYLLSGKCHGMSR